MEPLGSYITRWPRTVAALAFGSITMVVTHLAWVPNAGMSAMALTIAAGVAHALAGAITGRRLLDGTRTQTSVASRLDRSGYVIVSSSVILTGVRNFLACHGCSPVERIVVPAARGFDRCVFVSRCRVGAAPCVGRCWVGPLPTSCSPVPRLVSVCEGTLRLNFSSSFTVFPTSISG